MLIHKKVYRQHHINDKTLEVLHLILGKRKSRIYFSCFHSSCWYSSFPGIDFCPAFLQLRYVGFFFLHAVKWCHCSAWILSSTSVYTSCEYFFFLVLYFNFIIIFWRQNSILIPGWSISQYDSPGITFQVLKLCKDKSWQPGPYDDHLSVHREHLKRLFCFPFFGYIIKFLHYLHFLCLSRVEQTALALWLWMLAVRTPVLVFLIGLLLNKYRNESLQLTQTLIFLDRDPKTEVIVK